MSILGKKVFPSNTGNTGNFQAFFLHTLPCVAPLVSLLIMWTLSKEVGKLQLKSSYIKGS